MAQPTLQEVQRQWEGTDYPCPPFGQVNLSAPALAKWAYAKGRQDQMDACDTMQCAVRAAVNTRLEKERDKARKERDEMAEELAFVRRDRDMAEGQVARQRETIASMQGQRDTIARLNRQIAADARELNQKADTIRTLNAQLVESQRKMETLKITSGSDYRDAWFAVCDTLSGLKINWSGLRGTGQEAACQAIKDLKAQKDAAEKDWKVLAADYRTKDNIIRDLKATITVMQNLETDEVRRLKDQIRVVEEENVKRYYRICAFQGQVDRQAGTIIDLQERNAWQAAELNRMARKFVGCPWFDGITTGV